MRQLLSFRVLSVIVFFICAIIYSCSKGGGNTPNTCTGVTVLVTGTIINPTGTLVNGAINVTASGGNAPYTFSLNTGTFQANGNFINLGAGSYTIMAKDANGCTGSAVFTLTTANPCAGGGVTITISTVVTSNRPCEPNNGSIVATGAGGFGPYTYSLNGGVFQSSNNFSGLGAAAYVLVAKDANGCTGTVNVNVGSAPVGSLFTAVRNLLNNNCVSCHNAANSQGGMNWTIDCNVVTLKDRINQRAVHANPSAMPPTGLLPAAERAKITDWINAGGRYTD